MRLIKNILSLVAIAWFTYDMCYCLATVADMISMLCMIVVDISSEVVIFRNLGKIKYNVKFISVLLLGWYSFYLPIDMVSDEGVWTWIYCLIDVIMLFNCFIDLFYQKKRSYIEEYNELNYKDMLWKMIFTKS